MENPTLEIFSSQEQMQDYVAEMFVRKSAEIDVAGLSNQKIVSAFSGVAREVYKEILKIE